MALVAFLRGVNVGGHKTFRPSLLARALRRYDVVNVGAAGTFVVRKPGSRARLTADLQRRLPFDTQIMLCDGRDLLRLAKDYPLPARAAPRDVVRFVSILSKPSRVRISTPIRFPARGPWLMRVEACQNRYVIGTYRRHMKAIGYLGQIDRLFGGPTTTRNWNTIMSIVRILNGPEADGPSRLRPFSRRAR
jgi:uncharacterized protein (DUF1697 family)